MSFLLILISACGGGSGSDPVTQSTDITQYQGVAQKGPFEIGSEIIISQLDSSGIPTGNIIKTKVEESNGHFTYGLPYDWNIAVGKQALNISVNGFFFDESSGEKSDNKLSLSSITYNPASSSVNLLTDWIDRRATQLQKKGDSLKSAIEQSERELSDIFGISNAHLLDISQSVNLVSDNALLLLLSGAMMDVAHQGSIDPQKIIDEIASDFSDDGKLTEQGDDWFTRMQAKIRDNPQLHVDRYAKQLKTTRGLKPPEGAVLPEVVKIASRPVAVLPKEITVELGKRVVLDGSESHDHEEGAIINHTWFRVDQQTFTPTVLLSNRFSSSPTITVPNEESTLLFALIVTDEQDLTDTAVIKVIVDNPPLENNPPIADSQLKNPQTNEGGVVTNEDEDVEITLTGRDPDSDPITFVMPDMPLTLIGGTLDGTPPNLIYGPKDNFHGSDSFTFRVNDGFEDSNIATVDINVKSVNDAPVAVASASLNTVKSGEEFSLKGDKSFDVDGDTLNYIWEQIEGDSVVMFNNTDPNPGITAPSVTKPQDISFNLIVNDGKENSLAAKVIIDVTVPITTNQVPVAVAKATPNPVASGATISLDGSDSRDADGDTLTYKWSQTAGPIVNTFADTSQSPSPLAPTVTSTSDIDVTFSLVVNDGKDNSIASTVTIAVEPENQAPTALIKGPSAVTVGNEIKLDGGDSTDPDGTIVSYDWTTSTGETLSGSTVTFNAPISVGNITAELTVKDNDGATHTTSITITVTTLIPPTVNAGDDQTLIFPGEFLLVELLGTASDPDGLADGSDLTYKWKIVSSTYPSLSLTDDVGNEVDDILNPQFEVAQFGVVTLKLTVTDASGLSASDEITITVNSPPRAKNIEVPIADATPKTIVLLGSDPDGDNDELVYEILTSPEFGGLIFDGAVDSKGVLLNNANEVTYTQTGTPISDTFTYRVTDEDTLESRIATVKLIPQPVANPITDNINQGDPALIVPLAGLDNEGNSASVLDSSITTSLNGTVEKSGGNYLYTAVADFHGVDTFTYKVFDSDGFTSDAATVTININGKPTANAGTAQTVDSSIEGDANAGFTIVSGSIEFDGSGSNDPEDTTLLYQWTYLGQTKSGTNAGTGEINASAAELIKPKPTFTISGDFGTNVAGDYKFKLVVTDKNTDPSALVSEPATVVITVSPPGTLAPTANIVVTPSPAVSGQPVTLNGSGSSSNPAGAPLKYKWTQTLGTPVGFDETAEEFTFTPLTNDQQINYTFTLVVTDNGVDSSVETVTFSVNPVNLPIANAGPDQPNTNTPIVAVNKPTQLDGSGSSSGVTYIWTILKKPESSTTAGFIGSTVPNIDVSTLEKPRFVPDVAGKFTIQLIVNDGVKNSLADTVEIFSGNTLTLTVVDQFIGVGRTTQAKVTLGVPARTGGETVELTIDNSIASLSPTTLNFAQGDTEKNFEIQGVALGSSLIRADGGIGLDEVIANIEVVNSLISIDLIETIAPDELTSVVISISEPAPPQGLTISLSVDDASISTVSPITVFIPEGQQTPTANAQITGVDFGGAKLHASAPDFAADTRDILVALEAEFDESSLSVPETQIRNAVITLDSPAPSGGITFNLSATLSQSGTNLISFPAQVSIPTGQTQSQPIAIKGLVEGISTLTASATNFVDFSTQITVTDLPDAFLVSSSAYISEAVIGFQLSSSYRIHLETAPVSPVDIRISVPINSGVLLAKTNTIKGGLFVLFEDLLGGTPNFHIQGEALGDNVALTIEVFDRNTTTPAAYEIRPSTVDVDPSGISVATNDYATNTFANNRTIQVNTYLLYDDETPAKNGESFQLQSIRGDFSIKVPMESSDPDIVGLPIADGVITIGGNRSFGRTEADPLSAGEATLRIASLPAGFSLPTNISSTNDDKVVITVSETNAYLAFSSGSSQDTEVIVGKDLQIARRIRMVAQAPTAVDVKISVADSSGVKLSISPTTAGASKIEFTNLNSTLTPVFYIQGIAIGDDVPVNIEIVKTGTNEDAGFNILDSTIDVDPSGISVATNDYATNTFANNRAIQVNTYLLYDDETPAKNGQSFQLQSIRGDFSIDVHMVSSDPDIVGLPIADGVITIGGNMGFGRTDADPLSAGEATLSIATLPADFSLPTNIKPTNDDKVVVSVSATNAFLTTSTGSSHAAEVIVGKDLQVARSIRMVAQAPTAVDVKISMAVSDVLISKSATSKGESTIEFTNVTSTRTPNFYIQGIAIGDDMPITIEIVKTGTSEDAGFNILDSTVDVDPSGLSVVTNDYSTNTFASNRNIQVNTYLLYDNETPNREGQSFQSQSIRGDFSIKVPIVSNAPNVVGLPIDAGVITINENRGSGVTKADPISAGVATLSIASFPADFSLPTNVTATNDSNVVVTVDAPDTWVTFSSGRATNVLIGDELQQKMFVRLEVKPPVGNPVDVTVEVSAESVALISTDPELQGTKTVTFTGVTTTSAGTIYIQGLELNAATELKVTAAGYDDSVPANISIKKSGFKIYRNSSPNINVGQSTDIFVSSVMLRDNDTIASYQQQVRGGASFSFDLMQSNPDVGIYTTPLTLSNGDDRKTSVFSATGSGTTTISIAQPPGFTEPLSGGDLDITVN